MAAVLHPITHTHTRMEYKPFDLAKVIILGLDISDNNDAKDYISP